MSKINLRVIFNKKLYSILLNDYIVSGCKWNDIEHGKCIEYPVNKEDVFVALGVDKTIANLQSQLDQAKSEITKYKILLNDMETENSHLETMLDQANERLKKETEERQHLQCDYKTLLSHYNNLKEIAIARPKFEHFEEYWYIENNPYCDNELQVFNGKVMEIICAYDEDWLYEYRFDTSCRYIEEDNIFATEQEAQDKLKEMKGNE